MYYILEFIIAFLLIYLFYKIIVIKKIKKGKKKDLQTETKLFLALNKIDKKSIKDEPKLMNKLAIINALDVSAILLITEVTSSFILKFIIALALVFVVMILSYKVFGFFYKKGSNKNV